MENQPKFIKEFSKQESQEERNQAAAEIKQKRSENFAVKKELSDREKELQEKLEKIKKLEEDVAELSTGGLAKVKNYFKLRSLQTQLGTEKGALGEIQKDKIVPPDMEEPKRMLANFYGEQKKKWENSPYSKEDIDKNFSEEHLASLSVEDYALLMKRFPQEMVAHVTRQGIRDHTGHVYHTAGEGEYADGFMKILQDRRLRSPMGVHMIEGVKEETVAKYLELERFETEEEARNYLDKIVNFQNQPDAGSYADRMAVHFATEEVADVYYGSEKGNEIFIAYPSAHVASQYHFNGQVNKSGGGYWNDQWAWANEEKGMNVNAGLVFIPKEARVNHETGSRYELDEKGAPIVSNENINKISEVLNSEEIKEFLGVMEESLGKMSSNGNIEERYKDIVSKMEPQIKLLEDKFAIKDKRLQLAILDYNLLRNFRIYNDDPDRKLEAVKDVLTNNGIYYREASNSIDSQEFWEKYFKKHPEQRPSKIIYYEGNSPTDALYDWKKSKGLGRKSGDWSGELSDRKVDRGSMEATSGLERFRGIAEKVIDDYYEKKKTEELAGVVG